MAEENDKSVMRPRTPVRRFDVFAEFNRLKGIEEGMPEDEAAGYGLWVAKVVASRRWGGGPITKAPARGGKPAEGEQEKEKEKPKEKWHDLGGEDQTDELFDKEIVRRMGRDFYNKVFSPAIEEAYKSGRSYQSIRDTIRRDWKP